MTFAEEGISRAIHSTGFDACVTRDFHNSECLMDIDNGLLEQMSSVEADGAVNITQSRPHEARPSFWSFNDSSATEYAALNEETFLTQRNLPRVSNSTFPLPSQEFVQQFPAPQSHLLVRESVRCAMPPQNFTNPSHFERNCLSKTDSLVIMELLKNVRDVDASNEMELVSFLKQLMPIFEISPSCSSEVIKLLLPKVKGQLFQLWMDAVTARAGWSTLHEAILDRFVPSMRRREIEAIELDRPQRPGESFSEYVEHLLSTAFALKTGLSEKEVIEIALNKCRPETRSYFSFGRMPENIHELRTLATKVTSAVRAEMRYFGGSRTFTNSSFPPGPPVMNNRLRAHFQKNERSDFRNRPAEKL